VLLSWEGAVKVSDFGIAKAREDSAAPASVLIKGKVAYMSPEQANGEALDGRSDLFAVGIMLWELLTGRALFSGGTNRETLAQVMFGPIPRPGAIRPGVPTDLDAIAMRLLERERSARYAKAALAIEDLASCADRPRNGPGELARLLAERFPEAITARASQPQRRDDAPAANASPAAPDRVTVRDKPASEATLSDAASKSIGRARWRVYGREPISSERPRARWRWIAAGGLVLVGAAASTFALAVASRDRGRPPSPSEVAPTSSSASAPPAPAPPADAATIAAVPDAAVEAVPPSPPPVPKQPPPRPAGSRHPEPSPGDDSEDILKTRN
jgi:hypothetical protein